MINKKIVKWLLDNNKTISVAESLTGGLLSNSFVSVSGASKCFKGGIVAYTLEIKEKLLDIPLRDTIKTDGVDKNTSKLMAIKVSEKLKSDYAISTTGIAEKYDDRNEQVYITIVDNLKKTLHTKHITLTNEELKNLKRNNVRKIFVNERIKLFNDKIIMK